MPAPEQGIAQTQQEIQADLELILNAAHEAGKIALAWFGKDPEVWMKEGDSPVSEADHAADKYLRETLLTARPDYGWLSEETTDDGERLKHQRVFVVDPIDGTRGFIDGNPKWCVSVAIVENGRPYCGVLDCPALDEVYHAGIGGGAFLNGKRIAAGDVEKPVRVSGPAALVNQLARDTNSVIDGREFIPSLAYRIACVATGTLDGTFARADCHDWDIAAVDLIAAEAGAKLTTMDNCAISYNRQKITHGILVAGHKAIHGQMLQAASNQSKQNK